MSKLSLHYEEYGEGPCIVLLHGLFGASWHWKKIANNLARDHKVLVPDLRNHGHSPCGKEIDYRIMADDVTELMQKKGITLTDLAGHSMGGKVGLQLALNSSIIRKLVIVDISPRSYAPRYKDMIKELWKLIVREQAGKEFMSSDTHEELYDFAVKSFLQKNFNEHHKLKWLLHFPLLVRWYRNILKGIEVSAGFDKPVLFIRSACSGYVSESDVRMIHQTFVNADVVTCNGSGHWLHVDTPEILTKEIRAFLKK